MARTYRRGFDAVAMVWRHRRANRDWSCGNPGCCGGEVSRKARRRERAALRADLRRDPENASARTPRRDFY